MTSQIIIDSIRKCSTLVEEFRLGRSEIELEARLGRLVVSKSGSVHFETGVSHDYFYDIHNMLLRCKTWANQKNLMWVDTVDFHYGDLRATARDNENMTFIQKKASKCVNIVCREHPYDARVSTKLEKPVNMKMVKKEPDFVRVKRRMSFEYRKSSRDPVSHRFDLTIVMSGPNKWEAIKNPVSVTYEIEIEVVYSRQYLVENDNLNAAASLLEKTVDMLTRNTRDKPYSMIVLDADQMCGKIPPTALHEKQRSLCV